LFALGVLTACGAAGYGLVHLRPDGNVIRCFDDSAAIAQDYAALESHLAGLTPMEAVVRFDSASQDEANFLDRLELVRTVQERLRKHPQITGCFALPDLQPVADPPADGASMLAKNRYLKRANLLQDQIRGGEMAGTAALYTVADHGDKLQQPGDELWRITAQVSLLPDADTSQVLRDVNEIAQDVLRFQPGAHHIVSGAVPLAVKAEHAIGASFYWSLSMAMGLTLLLLMVQLRSVWGGVMGMVPGIVAIGADFGTRSWLGIPLDIGAVIAAPIAFGWAAHGALWYLTAFRRQIAEGRSRPDAVVSALSDCGSTTMQASLIAALGLFLLAPAELTVVSEFAWLMTAMVGAALLGNTILLPQLLASPVGRLFVWEIPSPERSQAGRHSTVRPAVDDPREPPLETAA
jgi:predicted RND superfamily exporter protein